MTDYKITLYNDQLGSFTLPDKDEPVGWQEIDFTMRRHNVYHGIFPEISLNLKWICTGKSFILECYYIYGIDADIQVHITAKSGSDDIQIYHGKLDLTTAKITVDYIECEIKPYNCLDLFLNRTSVPVNLYDEACYTELTYDKTAYRTRYKFAPYRILVRESPGGVSVSARTDFELKLPVTCGVEAQSVTIGNKFSLDGGIGCNLVICDQFVTNADCDTVVSNPCGFSDECDNATFAFDPVRDILEDGSIRGGNELCKLGGTIPRLFEIYYINNGVPLNVLTDDLGIFDTGYSPQNGANQYHRNCGNEIEDEEDKWDPEFEYNGEAQCSCCGETYEGEPTPCGDETATTTPPLCTGYKVKISAEFKIDFCLDIVEGEVDYVRFSPELVFQWGDYEEVITGVSNILFDNGCTGWDNSCTGNPNCTNPACGGTIWQTMVLDYEFTIPPCKVKSLDKLRIFTRTKLGFRAGADFLSSSDLSIIVNTEWRQLSGSIETADCVPGMPKIGDTRPNVYAIHESLSRVIEHYTNNCLRVKSDFFGRPNSMEWADLCDVQNTEGCAEPGSAGLDCCTTRLDFPGMARTVLASANYTPPDIPPMAVEDTATGVMKNAAFAFNDCGFLLDKLECIEFTEPGYYRATASGFIFTPAGSIISWVNTAANAYAYIHIRIWLGIGAYQSMLVDTYLDTIGADTDCNSDSIVPTSPFTNLNPPPMTFYVSPQMIADGDNFLCVHWQLDAGAISFTHCTDTPGYTELTAQAAFDFTGGSVTVDRPNCNPGYATSGGSMATSDCDCDNPEPFPVCNETFDPMPFQVANPSCYAYMVLTSGISLRQFGTECFVTFDDLFNSLNALFNLGVGYTENDPATIRIESWEYFYQESVILRFNNIDLYHAKYVRQINNDMYYNKFEFGYETWLNEKATTLYEFNTKRTYTMPVKHVDKTLKQESKYIASPYAIEKQRRDILNNNAEYDNEIFFICVGPSVDTSNTAIVTDGTDAVTYASHMWITEHGITYPSNFPSWKWAMNYRIAPVRCHFVHWEPTVNIGLWHVNNASCEFVKGDANYYICGSDPLHNNFNCTNGYSCENQNMPVYGPGVNNPRRIFPELVTIQLPLTVGEWRTIKLNPYGQIAINGELFFIKEVKFKINADSELTLIRASRFNDPTGP